MKILLSFFNLLFVSKFVVSQTVDTLIDVGGYKLHFHIINGKGTPILFEAGGGEDATTWKNILKPIAGITGTTLISYEFVKYSVSPDFGKTINWQIIQGRNFSADYPSDSSGLIINEAAAKYMGLENPIGTIIRRVSGSATYQIIGVVKDIITASVYEPVQQTIYFFDKSNSANFIFIKLKPDKTAHESVAQIGDVFKKYIAAAPFRYSFVSDEFAQKFSNEERIGKLAAVFAALAVFISCLGLFGMASFMAEQRTKEIGIRKVLGASSMNLWGLLSKEFVVLISISFLVAIPVAYYSMHNWLQSYNYRINISWWIFAMSGAGALLITLVTISFQSIKAAIANRVKSLRTE